MSKLFEISVIKTIRFNLYYFGIKGFRFPVLVSKNMIIKNIRGGVRSRII